MALELRGAAGVLVEEAVLRIGLTCRNTSGEPMPCGLGQHPYFPCSAGTRIETSVTHVWTIDEEVLPVEKVPASGRYDLSNRLICGQNLDNGFGGWSGRVLMDDPVPAVRVGAVVAAGALLPDLFARERRPLRRGAGKPCQCGDECPGVRVAGGLRNWCH